MPISRCEAKMRGRTYESTPRCIREDEHVGAHQGWSDGDQRMQWIDPEDERIWIAITGTGTTEATVPSTITNLENNE